MKKILYILMMLILVSCTTSNYEFEIKDVMTNETLWTDTVQVKERIFSKGEDVTPKINMINIVCGDTCYLFYQPAFSDGEYRNNKLNFNTIRPIYISKCKIID